jgi:hypothetical protein
MPMLFSFESHADADAFIAAVHERFNLQTAVFATHDDMEAAWQAGEFADVFPFQIDGVVAVVARTDAEREEAIEGAAPPFGGRFVGT